MSTRLEQSIRMLIKLFLCFFITYLLCGAVFLLVIRPIIWLVLTNIPYEHPTTDLLWSVIKALGAMTLISTVGLFAMWRFNS